MSAAFHDLFESMTSTNFSGQCARYERQDFLYLAQGSNRRDPLKICYHCHLKGDTRCYNQLEWSETIGSRSFKGFSPQTFIGDYRDRYLKLTLRLLDLPYPSASLPLITFLVRSLKDPE
jgi:hypothetical protein